MGAGETHHLSQNPFPEYQFDLYTNDSPKTHGCRTQATRVMPVVMKNQRKLGKDCREPQEIVKILWFYAALPRR